MHEELIKNLEKIFYLREISENQNHEKFLEEMEALGIDTDKISYSEFHVLNIIGENSSIKVTDIAAKMNMTRGAISKICSKLSRRKLISRKILEDNKKEVQYLLSKDGDIVYRLHKEHMEESREQMEQLLEGYEEDDIKYINHIVVTLIHPIVQL